MHKSMHAMTTARKGTLRGAYAALAALGFGLFLTGCDDREYVTPKTLDVKEVVFASGAIETRGQYLLTAAVDGYIESAGYREGDSVEDGARIATLSQESQQARLDDALASYDEARRDLRPDSPKIRELDLQIDLAAKERDIDRRNLERYTKLLEDEAISRMEYENQRLKAQGSEQNLQRLEDSKRDLLRTLDLNLRNADNLVKVRTDDMDDYHLLARGRSQVLQRYKQEGEYIRRGEALALMGKGAPIVKLSVEESDINRIAVGQRVDLSINTYGGRLFEARVAKIYPAFDETTQSFTVEAELVEAPEKLFPGTQVQANILVAGKSGVMAVPTRSVLDGNTVRIESGDTLKVVTGISDGQWTEIVSGLEPGTRIVLDPKID